MCLERGWHATDCGVRLDVRNVQSWRSHCISTRLQPVDHSARQKKAPDGTVAIQGFA